MVDDFHNKTIFLRPARNAVTFSVPVQFHQPLKGFIDSVEKVVVYLRPHVFIR